MSLKTLKKSDSSWDYAAWDGPSCLRRSVLLLRHRVQRLNSLKSLRRSVLPFRYEVQRVDFSTYFSEFLSVLKRDPSTVRRSMTVCHGFRHLSLFLQK